MVFGALMSAYVAIENPKREFLLLQIQAEVSATNLMAYRKSVVRYLEVNSTATGTISDASLAAFWLPGYTRDANWTNLISSNTLYVYSTAPTRGTLEVLSEKSNNSLLMGRKHDSNGRLISARGFDTGINLPAAIPNNAIVILGR